MLVLTRRPNQSIWIGDDIEVHVYESKGASIKLGIDAPPDVSIRRDEVSPETQPTGEALDRRRLARLLKSKSHRTILDLLDEFGA